jgi:hypothetical protein
MNETAQPAPEVATPNLGVADLVAMAQIIQIATSRGAWKPDELTTVGSTYDRLIAFLEASGAVARAPSEKTAEPEQPAEQPKEKKNVKARR